VTLGEFAARERSGKEKTLRLRFCVSPVAILGEDRVEAIEVVRNRLVAGDDGQIRAVPTGETETIPCGLVLRSVGYRGVGLPSGPCDESRCVIPNVEGRVVDAEGVFIPGVYCAGWIKRGPSGVIGTNRMAASETGDRLLAAARAGILAADPDAPSLEARLAERGVEPVEYVGWQSIDEHERGRGEPHGRPRVKLTSWDELLALARR
jgi:ferredoxin--NADP+ reductase